MGVTNMQKYKITYKDGSEEKFEKITDMEFDDDHGLIVLKVLVDSNTNIAVEGYAIAIDAIKRIEFNLDA